MTTTLGQSSITITVEPLPGSYIKTVAWDMCQLANKTGVIVVTNFNGIRMIVHPDYTLDDCRKYFQEEEP
jgi:hypothetical protein